MDLNLLLSVENPQNKAGPTGPHIEKLSISNSDRSNLCVWSVKTHRVSWRTQSYCTHNKDFLSVLLHIDLNVLQSKTPPPKHTHLFHQTLLPQGKKTDRMGRQRPSAGHQHHNMTDINSKSIHPEYLTSF